MAETVLKLHNLTKTYILGTRKNAKKAQKAIQKLQKKYLSLTDKDRPNELKKAEKALAEAQNLFSNDKYETSYNLITGKTLKKRPKDRGAIVHALRGVNLEIMQG